ncbi:MAG: hypothetical protein ACOX5R_23015 [bacterium]
MKRLQAVRYIRISPDITPRISITIMIFFSKGMWCGGVPGQHVNIKGQNWVIEDNEFAQGLDSNTRTGAYIRDDNDAIRFSGDWSCHPQQLYPRFSW